MSTRCFGGAFRLTVANGLEYPRMLFHRSQRGADAPPVIMRTAQR